MAPVPSERDALLAALDFHVEAGVDLALDGLPHDRFAEAVQPVEPAALPHEMGFGPVASDLPLPAPRSAERGVASPAASRPAGLPPAALAAPDAIASDARSRAADAATLSELEALLAAFDGCALKASARRLVFADGTPGSRVMLLGEAPGAEEDRTGRPFVGRAGQLLGRMLDAIGLDRTGVYIANVVPWRPPGNRTPTRQEIAICLPFCLRQIELAAPEILVTLGSPATQTMLGVTEGVTKMRGRWFDRIVGSRALRVLPMLHPAYLLRQPLAKRLAWRDLRALQRALRDTGTPEPAAADAT